MRDYSYIRSSRCIPVCIAAARQCNSVDKNTRDCRILFDTTSLDRKATECKTAAAQLTGNREELKEYYFLYVEEPLEVTPNKLILIIYLFTFVCNNSGEMQNKIYIKLTWRAQSERISCETGRTSANRIVVLGGALRSQSACVRARIRTFLIYTGQMRRALGINNTFRSARRRNARVFWQTSAYSLTIDNATFAVGSARRRRTRFYRFCRE